MEKITDEFPNLNLEIKNGECYSVCGCLGGKPSEKTLYLTSFKRRLEAFHPELTNCRLSYIGWDDVNSQRELFFYYSYDLAKDELDQKMICLKSRGYFTMHNFADLKEISIVLHELLRVWDIEKMLE
jgi:hypothetical protein